MKTRCLCSIIFVVIVLGLIYTSAYADSIMLYADTVFCEASVTLLSNKSVSACASTYDMKSAISIKSLWLEEKVDGRWVYSKSLTTPAHVAQNDFDFTIELSYEQSIGSGTFRIGCTFNADGYTISRYSNERTFNPPKSE